MAEESKIVSVGGPLLCPVLIGRAPQLAWVDRLLEEAAGGKGQAIFLRGEAGIGKSRLVGEARSMASRHGFLLVEGRCFEPDRSLPYAPFVDLLRTFFLGRSAEDNLRDLETAAPELIKLTPELASRLPEVAPTPALEPEQERRRLFNTFAQFLAGLTAIQPVLLVFEDLQWSDDVSLDLLLHLARGIESQPILLVLTYRDDEGLRALSRFLAELDRQRIATDLELPLLTRDQVDAMIRALFGQQSPIRTEFLDVICELTDGNPLFIEEVMRSLVEAGGIFYADGTWDRKPVDELHIPRSIQEAVRRRAEQASEPARQVLALAAVAGRRFDFALLKTLTQSDEATLLELVKELVALQFVIEESADRFAFRHALTRQAIYSELLARERRALHLTIAEVLEGGCGSGLDYYLEDLGYHFYEAGAWEKALDYSQRAGEKALGLFTPRAAILHLNRALEAARQLSVPPPPDILRSRAQAYETIGEFELALADRQSALHATRLNKDVGAECEALLEIGLLWSSRDYRKAGECYQRGLRIARQKSDQLLLARALDRVGNWYMNGERPLEALRHHREALAILQALNDQYRVAATTELLAMTNVFLGDLREAAERYREALTFYHHLNDRQGVVSCLASLALCGSGYQTDSSVPASTLAEAAKDAEMAVKTAQEIGWRGGESEALWNLAFCLGPQGIYGRALESAQRALDIADEIEHRQWAAAAHCALGYLYRDLLALPEASCHFERALALAEELASENWRKCAVGGLASTYLLDNALEKAESLLDTVLGTEDPSVTMGQRLCWCARAELALARGNPNLALEITDRLIASAPNVSAGGAIPRLWKIRGDALAVVERAAEAESVLGAAKNSALAQGAKSVLWRIEIVLGRLYHSQSRHGEAEQELMAAHTIVEEVASNMPDAPAGIREGFLRGTASLLPRLRPLSRRRAAREASGGLTARECDVGALLAEGKSNREIATALVVSERTVESHVSNILSKLHLASRAQIAAWVVARGPVRNERD